MSAIQKALGYLVRQDFARLWRAIAERIPSWLFRRNRANIYQLRVHGARPADASREELPEGCVFRKVVLDDLAACAEIAGLAAEECVRRHEAGDVCYGVFFHDEPVSVAWLHFGPCYIRGMALLLQADPSDCYVYGAVTAPSQRKRGLYKALQNRLIGVIGDAESRTATQLFRAGNAPVMATLPRLGYKCIAVLHHFTLLGVRRSVLRGPDGQVISRQWHYRAPVGVFRI